MRLLIAGQTMEVVMSSESTYRVKEILYTIQGEGSFTGTPAILLRLAGCNLWNGREDDRERDAIRTESLCPMFCDTDFVGGVSMTLPEIRKEIKSKIRGQVPHLCFVTGGEPLLQADDDFVEDLLGLFRVVAFETNGTQDLPFEPRDGVWITVSPKVPVEKMGTSFKWANEVKVVYPQYDPLSYGKFESFSRSDVDFWVQPCDGTPGSTGLALEFVWTNPKWRISVQTHKTIGVD